MYNEETEQTTHLSEYYYIITKHKWLIITFLIAGITLAVLYNLWMKPVYRSTATLVMNKDQLRSPLTGETLLHESFISQSLAFNTHLTLLRSRPVLEDVIRELKLDQADSEEDIETRPWTRIIAQFIKNLLLLTGQEKETPSSPQKDLNVLIGSLRGKISAGKVRDTLLLWISVEEHDPVKAKDVANALSRAYIKYDISNRLESSQNTVSWMSDQLYEMKKKLEDAEKEFWAYKQREKLFTLEGRQGLISAKIDTFNSAYIAARNKRLELDVKLGELKRISTTKGKVLHVRSLVDSPSISSLYNQLLSLEMELSRLSKVFKSKHPQITQMKSRMEKTRKKLEDELNKEVENLKSQRAVLLVREKALQKTRSNFENDALQTNRKELKYTILQRNVDTYNKLYNTLLSKVKQSDIAGNADVSNLRIAEKASVPGSPIRPRKKRNFMWGLILGLMTGLGLSFLWEYLDRSVRTEEDVRRYLGLPVLSVIPVAEKGKRAEGRK